MQRHLASTVLALSATLLFGLAGSCRAPKAPAAIPVGSFLVERSVVVPVTPEAAWSAFVDDFASWWDHSMSEEPYRFFLEAKPGGGFYEIFDASGDGVQHALVTFAQRPQRLVFRGPLGLHGAALDMVHTVTFAEAGEGRTEVTVVVRAMGEVQPGTEAAVNGAWDHFLLGRYQGFVNGTLP